MLQEQIASSIIQKGYFAVVISPKSKKGNTAIYSVPYVVSCIDGVFVAIFVKRATNLSILQSGGKSVVVKDYNDFVAKVGQYL